MKEKFNRMGKGRFLFFIPLGLAAIAGFTAIVMLLWNALLPDIFGITTITFWQALGILILSKILFGGFGPGKGDHHKHHRNKKHFRQSLEHLSE